MTEKDIKQIGVELQDIMDRPMANLIERANDRIHHSEIDVINGVDVVRGRIQNILHNYFPKDD